MDRRSANDCANMFVGIFDRCAADLESNGYALLPLPTLLQHNGGTAPVARAFEVARHALDAVADNEGSDVDAAPLIIDPSSDSGGWTGYHRADITNGRYNQHREGFVFSNGEMIDVMLGDGCNFEHEMSNLFRIMHNEIADGVLSAIERRLELPEKYFQEEVGPTDNASQWHMKRYVIREEEEAPAVGDEAAGDTPSRPEKEADIILPMHTDPSLVSVVILDRAGTNEGGMGLEVLRPSPSGLAHWNEISQHGHDVAVIFVGSVLSYLTKSQSGSLFAAVKHRVVKHSSDSNARMAATLFVRPNPNALMKSLPSPHLQANEAQPVKGNIPPTFGEWNARVAKNYMKKKRRSKKKF